MSNTLDLNYWPSKCIGPESLCPRRAISCLPQSKTHSIIGVNFNLLRFFCFTLNIKKNLD